MARLGVWRDPRYWSRSAMTEHTEIADLTADVLTARLPHGHLAIRAGNKSPGLAQHRRDAQCVDRAHRVDLHAVGDPHTVSSWLGRERVGDLDAPVGVQADRVRCMQGGQHLRDGSSTYRGQLLEVAGSGGPSGRGEGLQDLLVDCLLGRVQRTPRRRQALRNSPGAMAKAVGAARFATANASRNWSTDGAGTTRPS